MEYGGALRPAAPQRYVHACEFLLERRARSGVVELREQRRAERVRADLVLEVLRHDAAPDQQVCCAGAARP
ncbi:MAG: hypothetical protein U1F11_07360 [Steroidobacteraceae bacterium]